MAKIVVVGSCNIDITVECDRWAKPGETIFGNRLTVNPGGKGANQAVAAARLGAEVKMVLIERSTVRLEPAICRLMENSAVMVMMPASRSRT